MVFFNKAEKNKISEALTQAEAKTSGEIVAVVTRQSDEYRFIPLLWAALIALAIPLILIFLPRLTNWSFSFQPPENIYAIQLISFVVLGLFFQWQPMRLFVTPAYIKKQRAHRHAMDQFISQDLHHTSNRRGVLIFVSLSERYIEIIADRDIYKKVNKEVWKDIVLVMRSKIQNDQATEGFVEAIKMAGDLLEKHFPVDNTKQNELPNHLIEL